MKKSLQLVNFFIRRGNISLVIGVLNWSYTVTSYSFGSIECAVRAVNEIFNSFHNVKKAGHAFHEIVYLLSISQYSLCITNASKSLEIFSSISTYRKFFSPLSE